MFSPYFVDFFHAKTFALLSRASVFRDARLLCLPHIPHNTCIYKYMYSIIRAARTDTRSTVRLSLLNIFYCSSESGPLLLCFARFHPMPCSDCQAKPNQAGIIKPCTYIAYTPPTPTHSLPCCSTNSVLLRKGLTAEYLVKSQRLLWVRFVGAYSSPNNNISWKNE